MPFLTSANYTYEAYSRMTGLTAKSGTTSVVTTGITYKNPTSTTTSTQVYKWTTGGKTYTYTYDVRGNITAIADGTYTTTYVYDDFDQLTRENNQAAGKTWVYAYDNGGNILSKTEYAYTTGTLGTALDTITYGYGDSDWKDLLTSYDGQTLTSDNIGNLTNDGTWSYTWQHGRQLAQVAMGADPEQTLKAIREAEAYDGPSIVICYCPCIEHGMKSSMGLSQLEEKKAVECGYWHLYRYDPRRKEEGKNPFQLDSKKPEGDFKSFLMGENRYASLQLSFPEKAEALYDKAARDAEERYESYRKLAGE